MDNDNEAGKEMKICVLIPSHSPSFFTKMAYLTLKRELVDHELSVHIGYHSNLGDYTDDLSLFQDLEGLCGFHSVDEIDWYSHNADLFRYSKMHAKNLENLLENVKYFDFDYLVILDNDVYVKGDFVGDLLSRFPNCDLFGAYFDDKKDESLVISEHGDKIIFAPKISVWNLMISRKLFDTIISDTSIIYPQYKDGIFYDTFALVLKKSTEWGIKVGTIPTSEMSKMVQHFFFSSFNYGSRMKPSDYDNSEPYKIWDREFSENYKNLLK
jgi:hypothetical protein